MKNELTTTAYADFRSKSWKRIVLRKEQRKHLKSIEWLLFGKLACGKTTLLNYLGQKYKKDKYAKVRFEELGREFLYLSKGF